MTIYFNPYYSTNAFVTEKDCGLGVAVMGPFPLLNELELRSGNSRGADDGTQRTIRYMQAMKKAKDANPGIFFAKSFDRDDLGTAQVVLRWRDAIRKYGWTPFSDTDSEKLRGLAEVEPFFTVEGPADRWRAILSIARKQAILSPSDKIIVTCAKEDLESLYVEVLDAIEKFGTPVQYSLYNEVSQAPKMLSFKNDTLAHEWLSTQEFGDEDVLVGANRGMLNDMLYALGKPLIGNSEEGIGPVMRLFTLGLSLFENPVNITNLLAYLQLPKNPLGSIYVHSQKADGTSYRRSLSRVLADILSRKGGMGRKWNEALSGELYDYDGNLLDEETRTGVLAFIGMWNRTDMKTKMVKRDIVSGYTKALGRWAQRHFQKAGDSEDPLDGQYHALSAFCDSMKILLEGQEEMIDSRKISLWAGRIMTPITLSGDYARVGSINITSSLGNIHSAPKNIVWVSADTKGEAWYEFGFLSKMDREDLRKHGVIIPEREDMLSAQRKIMMNALAMARDGVTIVTIARIGAEQTSPNLIVAELSQKFSLKAEEDPFMVPLKGTGMVITDSGKKVELQIDSSKMKGFSRSESASSIDTLINHPFDYYVAHVAKLEGYGVQQMGDLKTVKGNVAHKYIEQLGSTQGHNISKMKSEHAAHFEEIVDMATREKGILLLSEENAIEYRNFKMVLQRSIKYLLELMESRHLTIVEQEYKFSVKMDPFGEFNGYIDCLLQNEKGEYVIFDFKWSESQRYKDKAEHNRALQLALYEEAIKIDKGPVAYSGYYVFPQCEFYQNFGFIIEPGSDYTEEQLKEKSIFTQACNSYLYRMEQMCSGILEDADGLAVADTLYENERIARNLYPLDSYDGYSKDYSYGDTNLILKGDLK